MKFAHMADCHIGSWREQKMKVLSMRSFIAAVDSCIDKKVDFILIAGDLFNTSVPGIDELKEIVLKLRELRKNNIPVYIIAGSHDYSPSGKTMIDVLENAGLVRNVYKGEITDKTLNLRFVTDEKTGAKITGIVGRKGMLDKKFYENLHKSNLEQEDGFKIFMLHTAISEIKPKELDKMQSMKLSGLPKGFDYYAAGHVHYIFEKEIDGYGTVVYPGALFPANFAELEKYKCGGFYIYEDGKLSYEKLNIVNVETFLVECDGLVPEEVMEKLNVQLKNREFYNTIVLIRFIGELKAGRPSDLNYKELFTKLYLKGAYYVMKSSYKLSSKQFEEIKQEDLMSNQEVEDELIENQDQILDGLNKEKMQQLIRDLMQQLSEEKGDMTVAAYTSKIVKEVDAVFDSK